MGISGSPSYLAKHNHIFYFRMAVPPDLSSRLSKTEYRHSLRTAYLTEARKKVRRAAVTMHSLCDHLRSERSSISIPSDTKVQTLAEKWLKSALEEAEGNRLKDILQPAGDEAFIALQEALDAAMENASSYLKRGRHDRIAHDVEEFLTREEIDIDKESPEFTKLCREFLKREYVLAKIEGRRILGFYDDSYVNGPPSAQERAEVALGFDSVPLTQVIDEYTHERLSGKRWTEKSKQENHACYALFLRFAGEDIQTKDIDYKLIRAYRDALQQLPSNLNKAKAYRDKSLQEVLGMEIKNTMSISTVNKYLNRLASLLAFAVKSGYLGFNPAEKMELPQPKKDNELRQVFTPEDLRLLFHSQEYREDTHKKPFQFRVPVIALFTGMRLNEIAQLHLEDIRQEDGIWVFDINGKGSKKLKNNNSKRLVPLHPFLSDELKLPLYAESLSAAGEARLFPDLPKARDGYGQTVSRWFNGNSSTITGYKHQCGIVQPKSGYGKDFHSFRHTLIDHLKQKMVEPLLLHALDGHSMGTMTMDRYGKDYRPSLILEHVVAHIDFDRTVGLDHLKDSKFVKSGWGGLADGLRQQDGISFIAEFDDSANNKNTHRPGWKNCLHYLRKGDMTNF